MENTEQNERRQQTEAASERPALAFSKRARIVYGQETRCLMTQHAAEVDYLAQLLAEGDHHTAGYSRRRLAFYEESAADVERRANRPQYKHIAAR